MNGYPTEVPLDELTRLFCQDVGASICVIGSDLRFKFVNEPFARALGFTPNAMVDMTMLDAYGEAHFEAITSNLRRVLSGESLDYERFGKLALRDGLWRTVALRPWRDASGEAIGIIGVSMQVQELKNSAEKLRAANERLSSHMQNSPLTVVELDARLLVTHCSPRASQMFGLDADALIGNDVLATLGGADADTMRRSFERLQQGQESRNRFESTHQRADRSIVHCEWFNSALTDARGEITSIMSLIEDVTVRVQVESELRRMASHDPLTGLRNRGSLEECLDDAIARAGRSHIQVSVLFVDLDGFKRVNDNYGHAAGDQVLCEVALRLKQCVREGDTVGRVGGDEFVVIPASDGRSESADSIAQRLLEALAEPISFKGGSAQISASIGIAQHPPFPGDAKEMLKSADAAMYEAKRAGKGCVRTARS
jgi:diguanylate cyclase (GGDEF)-like protein/PAS domain S-box-containing protein